MGYVKNLAVVKEYDLAIIIPTFEYVERFKNELMIPEVYKEEPSLPHSVLVEPLSAINIILR